MTVVGEQGERNAAASVGVRAMKAKGAMEQNTEMN